MIQLILRRANSTWTYSAYIFTKSHDHILDQMRNKSADYGHRFPVVGSVGDTRSCDNVVDLYIS